MTKGNTIFFVRHILSESNNDPLKRVALGSHQWRIPISKDHINQMDITTITEFAEQNQDARFAIISSPFDRTVETSKIIKNRLGKRVLGIKTWGELVEFNAGSEVRVNTDEAINLYGPEKNADFYARIKKEPYPHRHEKAIDGESLSDLLLRSAATATKILQMSQLSRWSDIGISVTDFIPIYVGHCWQLNGVFSKLGLFRVEDWKDIKTIKNAYAIRVEHTNIDGVDAVSSPNLDSAIFVHKTPADRSF